MQKYQSLITTCKGLKEREWFKYSIISTILVASLVAGLQSDEYLLSEYKMAFYVFDWLVLLIFSFEICVKLLAAYPKMGNFFKDGWNVFDFLIVLTCFVPTPEMDFVPVFRLFRILRILRLFSALPKLQMLITALIHSLPSMIYILVMMGILFYVYAVTGTLLFKENDPVHFGTLGRSAISLFSAITLEDWPEQMYIQYYGSNYYGYNDANMVILMERMNLVRISKPQPVAAVMFFCSFIFFGAIIIVNLFVGVILNGIHEVKAELETKAMMQVNLKDNLTIFDEMHAVSQKLDELKGQMAALHQRLKSESDKDSPAGV